MKRRYEVRVYSLSYGRDMKVLAYRCFTFRGAMRKARRNRLHSLSFGYYVLDTVWDLAYLP